MSGRNSSGRRFGYQPGNQDEVIFCRLFDAMFDIGNATNHRSTRDIATVKEASRCFFAAIESKGDDGYRLAGKLLRETVEDFPPHRATLSRVMTSFARQYVGDQPGPHYVDSDGTHLRAFPESRIYHVGRLIAGMRPEISERVSAALVSWCEDMNVGIPESGQEPAMARQETAVIRGSILSTSLDQAQMKSFWGLALKAANFPWRIFSDPCRSERGVIFAPTHVAAIAKILTVSEDAVVRHVADWMLKHAVNRRREARPGGVVMPYDVVIPATLAERQSVFKAIAGQVDGEQRRGIVTTIFSAVTAQA